jgi:hypothetical protein
MRHAIVIIAALAGVMFPAAAFADDCGLHQTGSLDLTEARNAVLIPVTVNDTPQNFVLGLESGLSRVHQDAAASMNMPTRKLKDLYPHFHLVGDDTDASLVALVPTIAVGGMADTNFKMIVANQPIASVPGAPIGTLGIGALETRDLELDIAHRKLNLFLQDHCSGHVVYWTDSAAQIPMIREDSGDVIVEMELDHVSLRAKLHANIGPSIIGMNTMRGFFGLDENSPGMTRVENRGSGKAVLYRYAFTSLNVGGLSIAHPDILVRAEDPDRKCQRQTDFHLKPERFSDLSGPEVQRVHCYGVSQLQIGLSVLRQLRLFFAFKEKKLYITAADAH